MLWPALLFGIGLGCTGNWDCTGGVGTGVWKGCNCNCCCINNVEGDGLWALPLHFLLQGYG